MRKAWGYCRVSHQHQVQSGDSLENQKRMIEAVCVLEGYELAGIFCDAGISGSIPLAEREQGSQLLASVEKGDIIIGLKLDRLFRDAHDAFGTLKQLQKQKVGLYLKDLGGDVTSDSVSGLVFGLLASVANFERIRIGERIADIKRHHKQMGRFLGGRHTPFGFRKVQRHDPQSGQVRYYVEPIEDIHAAAREMKAQGVSLRKAADAFKAQGHVVSHMAVKSLYQALS